MDFLAEILVNLVFMLVIFMVQWGKQHKEATVAILVVGLMIIDVVFVLKHFGYIG